MSHKLGKKEVITPFVLGATVTFLTILFAFIRGIESTVIQDAKIEFTLQIKTVKGATFVTALILSKKDLSN
jgi:hypothetical protein